MESRPASPTAAEAASALSDAEAARRRLADGIQLPSWFLTSVGGAVGVQIATTAVGVGTGEPWGTWALLAGLVTFVVVAGVQLTRFRRLNGVWLGGLASRVVFGTAASTWVPYAAAMVAASFAAADDRWWLVALSALAGGAVYGLSGRRWLRTFHDDPAAHGRGESAVWLGVMVLVAIAGLAALLLDH
jgi:hypothetical protein